jgi:succinoglycan biosynthesis transport protein ExoP
MNKRSHQNVELAASDGAVNSLRERPLHSGPVATARVEQTPNLLTSYVQAVGRYAWVIAGCAASGLVLGLLITVTTLPVYEAKTWVDIQSLNGDFMDMKSVAQTSDQSASTGDVYVQTQIKLLESETLLDDTAAGLQVGGHPATVQRNDLVSRWKRRLHLGANEMPYSQMVDYAAQHIKVKPLGLTRLIEINCDSWDAAFSAKFCNSLTQTFQTEDQQSRALEAEKTSEWLSKQAEDVRLKAQQSQKDLETAIGGNGLMLSQGTDTVGEDRLRDIQQELVRAQADRMEKEAQEAIASSSTAQSVPGIADRATYQSYQMKLAELNSALAKLVPEFKEDYPKVIQLRSQIKEVEDELAKEQNADVDRIRNDYDASRHREELLRATYEATAANVSTDLKSAARVRLLRSEVDSEEQLYQTLLQRAKEAGFASAMHASTLRVVDAARSSGVPIEPRRGSSAVLGLFLGSLAGVGFAFFKDRQSGVLRLPGDTSRYLNLHELGVIPSANTGTSHLETLGRKLPWAANRGVLKAQHDGLALVGWDGDFSLMAEAYRSATLSILFTEAAKKKTRTYVIASPNAGDGKTSVTCNVGVALSKSKLRVLLIDGDLRRPTLHNALGVSNRFGLRDILRDETALRDTPESELFLRTKVPNLWLLPSGSGKEQVLDLLHSANLQRLLEQLNRSFDVVLIDTPPMLHMADARLFADHTDGVILVVRSGVTMRDDAASALEKFEHDGVRVLGTILNDFDPVKQGQSSYYRSYYQYKNQYQEVGAR